MYQLKCAALLDFPGRQGAVLSSFGGLLERERRSEDKEDGGGEPGALLVVFREQMAEEPQGAR